MLRGVGEVREGRNGFQVPIKDAAALASAMNRFLDFPDLIASMGAQSREFVAERFDVTRVNADLLDFMELQ